MMRQNTQTTGSILKVIAISSHQNGVINEAFSGDNKALLIWMGPQMLVEAQAIAPDLIVIDASIGQSCEAMIRSARGWSPSPAIITIGDIPASDLRALIGHPSADAMADTISAQDLRALATHLMALKKPVSEAGKSGQCWAFTGAVGGAGASLITIETAYQLMNKSKRADESVCLIDLNFEDGSLATYLDISPGLDVSALTNSPDRIDAALLSAFVSEHESGLKLIASPRGARFGQAISAEAVLRLLEVACDCYDFVVVDLPRWREPWTAALVQGADHLIIVSELTVPALHAARHLSEDFERLSSGMTEPEIILNRMSKRMFGHSVSVGQAETALQRRTLTSITSDWDAAAAAVNMGMPVSMARPGAKMAKDVAEMVDKLTQTEPDQKAEKVA